MAYKNKKFRKIQPMTAFLIITVAALAVFLVVLGITRATGQHNTTVVLSSGEQVKYVGTIDGAGNLVRGTLYYENGMQIVIDSREKRVTYADGSVYVGDLDGDYRRHGRGKLSWPKGDSYEGTFVADAITGSGVFTFANGDVYEGELRDGKKHGTGKYTAKDGSVYEGGFVNDKRHGRGTHRAADGSVYVGTFLGGVKSGSGSYTYSNGDRYEGQFKGDLRHGEGRYVWSNGETYTGQFANGNMNGYGTYTWPTGRASYTGYFEDGVIVVVKP